MAAGDHIDRFARVLAIAGERHQLADIVQAEAKVARAADERQAIEVFRSITAVIAAGPRRLGKQAFLLVPANRFYLRIGCFCQIADSHRLTL